MAPDLIDGGAGLTAAVRKPIAVETVLILAMICMGVLLYLAARPPDL